jgi:hypothetical protein
MKKKYHFAAMTTCLFLVIFMVCPCHAETSFREQVGEYGFIDWLSQRVYAKGIGIFPQNKPNILQAEAMTRRAALVVAQRNLLGVIKGVHIDSQTLIENRLAQDDTIVARIEGIVQFCRVEDAQVLEDRAVEVIVSMPIFGKLGQVLVDLIEESAGRSGARTPQEVALRLRDLENRVQLLEEKISDLKKISVQKEDLIILFRQLNTAWQEYAAERAVISPAGYASNAETAAIRNALADQERHLASLSIHLEDLSQRLSAVETAIDKNSALQQPSGPSKDATPYTGLIVDARRTAFKPCLKPTLFINGRSVYPGDFLDIRKAVSEGYVRYYSDPQQAQQSERIGALPYVAEAIGIYDGDRSLSLAESAYPVLASVLERPDNFLARGRVVILF